MDDSLHCNWLKCRKSLVLEGRAVVTTCSHIFCVSCAETLFTADKACPACKTILDQPDDVVLSSLNPSVDYRTSVLAGLAPDVIIDIAGRSLGFWTYQQSQEAAFQKMVYQAATERNTLLEKRVQSILVEANGEINLLQQKITNLDQGLAAERRRTRELQEALRAATKDYERLKLRMQQDQRRRSSGGAHSAPAPDTPQPGIPGRSESSTSNFWQANSKGFVPPSPKRGANVDIGTGARNAFTGGTNAALVNPLLNHAGEPSSNHDRFKPGQGNAIGLGLNGRGMSRSPPGGGGGFSSTVARQQQQQSHTGQQSVFGQLASPSLGHLQPGGRGDIPRSGSKIPESTTSIQVGPSTPRPVSRHRRESSLLNASPRGQSHALAPSMTNGALRFAAGQQI